MSDRIYALLTQINRHRLAEAQQFRDARARGGASTAMLQLIADQARELRSVRRDFDPERFIADSGVTDRWQADRVLGWALVGSERHHA
jgi:hypothetical protein